ncbi:GNAT family N-acetyltransferase [Riemerella columbina]|uniref:GNAT family N-acetyltransferase n=1 Tax=Riemerella columbina TaxID=103810 RepID=UPI00039D041C|nr:GNAT family N-acetyltransferase [Riemerella columbina]
MNYKNNQSGNGGFITMENGTEEIGRLTYTIMPNENILVISFVNVYPKFEGNGYGKYLVQQAIDFAREHQWKIRPHCSYAGAVMQRMSDIEDVFPI